MNIILPSFSWFAISHPPLAKAALMSFEYLLNIVLFLLILKKFHQSFISIFISIIIAKTCYYLLKYLAIQAGIVEGEFISTSLHIQLISGLVYCLYIQLFFNKNSISSVYTKRN
ncbi:MAG: hypothetical protein HY738_08985 [Bacteroidia bacterium]|nr:hypothetical protein [Bacteroidia bacterium]